MLRALDERDTVRNEFTRADGTRCAHEIESPGSGRYPVAPKNCKGRLIVRFGAPVRLESVRVEAPCSPSKLCLLASLRGGVQKKETYTLFEGSEFAGYTVNMLHGGEQSSWDEARIEFAGFVDPTWVKPLFRISPDERLPSWDECFRTALGPDHEDFVFRCNDGREVRMNSTLLLASCGRFQADTTRFGDAGGRSLDLSATDDWPGFDSATVSAAKRILMTRDVALRNLETETALGLNVARLLYFLLATGKERVWNVFSTALPSLNLEKRMLVLDLACEHGDSKTTLACAKLAAAKGGAQAAAMMAKLKEHMHLFIVRDPVAFVGSLGFVENKAQA